MLLPFIEHRLLARCHAEGLSTSAQLIFLHILHDLHVKEQEIVMFVFYPGLGTRDYWVRVKHPLSPGVLVQKFLFSGHFLQGSIPEHTKLLFSLPIPEMN